MKTSTAKADFVQPILVLTLICLIASLLLAVINNVTKPIIDETEAQIAEMARAEVLPEAEGFTKLDAQLPDGTFVTEAYEANNGAGYVFTVVCNGYGGKGTMKIICGIDSEGRIVSTKVLNHKETAGLGSKITEPDFAGQFPGLSDLDGVDTIGGATFSSNYFIEGIQSALDAFHAITG